MTDKTPDVFGFELLPGNSSYFNKKPPTPPYRVAGVPTRLVDQVQLSAVLRSFYGYGRLKTKADFADATAWMLCHWRSRSKDLAEAGWKPIAGTDSKSRLRNALACPVAFVITFDGKKGRKPCGLATLCPFCWAREVRRYWLKLEAIFFPPIKDEDKGKRPRRRRIVDTGPEPKKSISSTRSVEDIETGVKSPYDLVYRRFAFQLEPEYQVRAYGRPVMVNGLVAWLESRLRGQPDSMMYRVPECRALLTAAGPRGGLLESVSCHRNIGPAAEQAPWEVQVHQLILAADGDTVPRQLHETATEESKRHIVIRKPHRTALAQRVSEAFVYPRFLVDPATPVEHVVEYLNIRRNHRLVASYGRFRDKK